MKSSVRVTIFSEMNKKKRSEIYIFHISKKIRSSSIIDIFFFFFSEINSK